MYEKYGDWFAGEKNLIFTKETLEKSGKREYAKKNSLQIGTGEVAVESEKVQVFEMLYEQNADLVLKIAVKYSGDVQIAQKVMQDTFIRLYKHMDEIEEEFVRDWLLITAKNLALNCSRKRR